MTDQPEMAQQVVVPQMMGQSLEQLVTVESKIGQLAVAMRTMVQALERHVVAERMTGVTALLIRTRVAWYNTIKQALPGSQK